MSQPEWKCVAQLGDASPTEFGGYWIFVDTTGVYPPEAEFLDVPTELDHRSEDEPCPYANGANAVVRRFILEPCTYVDGVLSDNPSHPEMCAWFATTPEQMLDRPQDGCGLLDIADYCGMTVGAVIAMLCSDNPISRAHVWRLLGEYHGFDNLDEYPLHLTAKEVEERYSDPKFQVTK